MLTAKGDEEDELTGFELGVDEYISKPFSPKILVARVGAILRRSGKAPEEGKLLSIGGIVIIGTFEVSLISLQTSHPFIFGIMTSKMINAIFFS